MGTRKHRLVAISLSVALAVAVGTMAILLMSGDDEELPDSVSKGGYRVYRDRSSEREATDPRVIEFEGGPTDELGREAILSSGVILSGTVVDKASCEPVQAFEFHLIRLDRETRSTADVLCETVRDDEGRFAFALEQGGPHSIYVASSRHCRERIIGLDIPEETGLRDLQIELDPGDSISGRVVEDATDRPVENALVLGGWDAFSAAFILYSGREEVCPHAWTDREGKFVLEGARERDAGNPPFLPALQAFHPDYTKGIVEKYPGDGESVVIRLGTGYRVFGKAYDDAGRPCQGVLIWMQTAPSLFMPVLTGTDGSYRTQPIRPGRLEVSAGSSRFLGIEPAGFSDETRIVEIVDRDVEVDFKLESHHVTWRGTFYERDEPVAGGIVRIMADRTYAGKYGMPFIMNRSETCDDAGRFEFGKLIPGRYDVGLQFSNAGVHRSWGTITLDNSGIVEKDIRLTGFRVSGVVVDEATGEPLDGNRFRITCLPEGLKMGIAAQSFMDGRFTLRGIPPGACTLNIQTHDRPAPPRMQIDVPPDRDLDGIRIIVPFGGKLIVHLEGFEDPDVGFPDYVYMDLRHDDGSGMKARPIGIGKGGQAETSYFLEPGQWTAVFHYKGERHASRRFTIEPDLETHLHLALDEMQPLKVVTLAGSLTRTDGSPVAGIEMSFNIHFVGDRRRHTVTTDAGGEFRIENVRPGTMQVHVDFDEDRRMKLPDLIIPYDAEDVHRYDVVLQSGVVTGTLRDGRTGLHLSPEGPGWEVNLSNIDGSGWTAWQRNASGPRFRVEYLPEGEYEIMITFTGYRAYRQSNLVLGNGKVLDVGDIALEPCGVLDLKVVDRDGKSVRNIRVNVKGANGHLQVHSYSPSGEKRYSELPLGEVTFLVGAWGFESQEIALFLEPAKPVTRRVVLERE